ASGPPHAPLRPPPPQLSLPHAVAARRGDYRVPRPPPQGGHPVMSAAPGTIIWTEIDEAPALATHSLLPIVRKFTAGTGITIETADISLAGRIIANFPDDLTPAQRVPDWLTQLGELAKQPEANIVKLPNISASVPQLKAAIRELQGKGYKVPDYPENPTTPAEQAIKARYAKVLGSAVNPVLREGNSDRRAAGAVKAYAKKHPHKLGPWTPASKAHVATMHGGDFATNEKSVTVPEATTARIEFVDASGKVTVLKDKLALKAAEVIDGTFMSSKELVRFLEAQIEEARKQGLLFPIHLKATMMKVSDPIIFGFAVRTFFREVFDKHAAAFKEVGVDPNNGLGDLYAAIKKLPAAKQAEIETDIQACYAKRPPLAMVNADRGITNLHVPSDMIIDASIPPMIPDSGQISGPHN